MKMLFNSYIFFIVFLSLFFRVYFANCEQWW